MPTESARRSPEVRACRVLNRPVMLLVACLCSSTHQRMCTHCFAAYQTHQIQAGPCVSAGVVMDRFVLQPPNWVDLRAQTCIAVNHIPLS